MDSQWTVGAADAGVRLDKFLASPERLGSRGRAAAALERAKVFLNGSDTGLEDASRRLVAGDVVRLWMDRPGSAKPRPTSVGGSIGPGRSVGPGRTGKPGAAGDLRILHEDDWILVLDKPAGLLAVPLERKRDAPSVFDRLEEHYRSRGKRRPFVVHRIDRDTSGVVLFAKQAHTQEQLKGQFRRREPERVYLAVVYGRPDPPEGRWHDYLVWDSTALIQKETHPRDPRAKEAISNYRLLESFRGASLVEVRLHTGRRNQIRIQARLRGHTLVGERRYTFGPDELRPIAFHRQALHAHRLAIQHPEDGRRLEFEAPLPADLLDLLARLRRA